MEQTKITFIIRIVNPFEDLINFGWIMVIFGRGDCPEGALPRPLVSIPVPWTRLWRVSNMPYFGLSLLYWLVKETSQGVGYPDEVGIGDVMAFGTPRAEALRRRR